MHLQHSLFASDIISIRASATMSVSLFIVILMAMAQAARAANSTLAPLVPPSLGESVLVLPANPTASFVDCTTVKNQQNNTACQNPLQVQTFAPFDPTEVCPDTALVGSGIDRQSIEDQVITVRQSERL